MVQTWNTSDKYRGQVGPLGLITSGGRIRRARRIRLVRRMTLVAVAALLFLLTATMALARRNGSKQIPAHVSLTVQSGDTLWKLAHRYGDPRQYILERVDDLANENNLQADSVLQPGQRILIPVRNVAHLTRIQASLKP